MITREQLVNEIQARLDERLDVEDPQPYGEGIAVMSDGESRVLVVQPGGPHFAITVHEGALGVPA